MKRCPYCIADIASEAQKCRYCGEWVVTVDETQPSVNDGDATCVRPIRTERGRTPVDGRRSDRLENSHKSPNQHGYRVSGVVATAMLLWVVGIVIVLIVLAATRSQRHDAEIDRAVHGTKTIIEAFKK